MHAPVELPWLYLRISMILQSSYSHHSRPLHHSHSSLFCRSQLTHIQHWGLHDQVPYGRQRRTGGDGLWSENPTHGGDTGSGGLVGGCAGDPDAAATTPGHSGIAEAATVVPLATTPAGASSAAAEAVDGAAEGATITGELGLEGCGCRGRSPVRLQALDRTESRKVLEMLLARCLGLALEP